MNLAPGGVPARWSGSLLALGVLLCAADPCSAQMQTLNAHPGPTNNGGSPPGWAVFFDLTAPATGVRVSQLTTASTAAASATFTVEVFTRTGTALGGPVASGPGSSPAGWTSLGTAVATQGAVAAGVSLPIDIPDIVLAPGQLTGVALRFVDIGPRYFGTGTPAYSTFSDANLTLVTGDARTAPFTTTGTFFASRALVGSLIYWLPAPDCGDDPNNLLQTSNCDFDANILSWAQTPAATASFDAGQGSPNPGSYRMAGTTSASAASACFPAPGAGTLGYGAHVKANSPDATLQCTVTLAAFVDPGCSTPGGSANTSATPTAAFTVLASSSPIAPGTGSYRLTLSCTATAVIDVSWDNAFAGVGLTTPVELLELSIE